MCVGSDAAVAVPGFMAGMNLRFVDTRGFRYIVRGLLRRILMWIFILLDSICGLILLFPRGSFL